MQQGNRISLYGTTTRHRWKTVNFLVDLFVLFLFLCNIGKVFCLLQTLTTLQAQRRILYPVENVSMASVLVGSAEWSKHGIYDREHWILKEIQNIPRIYRATFVITRYGSKSVDQSCYSCLRSFHWNRTYTEIFVKLCLLIV